MDTPKTYKKLARTIDNDRISSSLDFLVQHAKQFGAEDSVGNLIGESELCFLEAKNNLLTSQELRAIANNVPEAYLKAVFKDLWERVEKVVGLNVENGKTASIKTTEVMNVRFDAELDKFRDGKLKPNEVLHLGSPLAALQAAGIKEAEIIIRQSMLAGKLKQHNLTIEDLKGLASAIQTPTMVYEWGTKAKSTIIISDLTRGNDEKITVAVRAERNGKSLLVNDVSSVHGKSTEQTLLDFSKAVGENPIRN
ncbi:MAG: hypothetical protein LBK47_07930 [Prevotellaceae bacterium]|jgi:hypothetical protein|nr:hypothetical protein [Prevotellaceae bacterium]